MAFNATVFKTRALTALIFVMVMLVGLLYSYYSFVGLFLIVLIGCWYELVKLLQKINIQYAKQAKAWIVIMPILASVCLAINATPIKLPISGAYIFIGLLIVTVFSSLLIKTTPKGLTLLYHIGGILYIGGAIASIIDLRNEETIYNPVYSNFNKGLIIPLTLIASIWINDTMAYIVGSFIGKTPFSTISPKKTWEGTIGGAILAVVFVSFITVYALPVLPLAYAIAISATAAIMGTIGDLWESKLKRMANVKDSGSFMPGHGGFLDRFDSLLIAAPFVYLILLLLQ
jgi:phosphatidate cytidylyltransferase